MTKGDAWDRDDEIIQPQSAERTADRRDDDEEPSTLELMLVQLTRIADALEWTLSAGGKWSLTPPEVHDLADGPIEIPAGETRTIIIRDPDDAYEGRLEDRET